MVKWEGSTMVLEWREWEHEDMDRDAPTVNALRQCRLLKFFCTSPMRANVCLLEHLIRYWDHDLETFDLQGEILEIALEDIYFIMRLSCRGIPMNLEGIGRGGDPMRVQDYVDTYCMPESQKKGSCIPIVHITNFPPQLVVSTIVRVVGSSPLHLDTRT